MRGSSDKKAEAALRRIAANDPGYTDSRIDLCRRKLGDAGARRLADALRRNTALLKLDVMSNAIGGDGAAALADALAANAGLAELRLGLNALGPPPGAAAVPALSRMLECNTALRLLDLTGCGLGDAGVAVLCAGLQKNHTLRKLVLDLNGVREAGAEALAHALTHDSRTALTVLSLARNDVGAGGAAALRRAVALSTSLFECRGVPDLGDVCAQQLRINKVAYAARTAPRVPRLRVPLHAALCALQSSPATATAGAFFDAAMAEDLFFSMTRAWAQSQAAAA